VSAVTAHVDGGARGNPGPAGYGVRLTRDDGSVVDLKASIGIATNNVAEYHALLAALRWAVDEGVTSLSVKADSELLVKQMLGEYRVKNPGLLPLYEEARRLANRIGHVQFAHVRREHNQDADRLANEAMDEAGSPPPAARPALSPRGTT
jgi:probable phosphoglycerate mutase